MQIDMRALELLASKLCHDLVSPVSAINNGVELIEDIGGQVEEEAMKLIADSAQHASRRLRLFRLAYGRAGSEENLGLRDARQIAEQYIAGGKVNLTWAEDQPAEALVTKRGCLKVVVNLLILAEETLAYGGAVSLHALADPAQLGCRIEVAGRNAQLSPLLAAALEGTSAIDDLTPRSIQSYITGRFAAHFGFGLRYDHPGADRLDLSLLATPA